VYSASKAAVVQYSKVLARELAPFNITCNVVAPSLVSTTGMLEDLKKEAITKYLDGLTIKRLATPEDVAHAVSFFVDEASGYVTGQVLYLGLAD
jgi:3-oxoacyl-[acyl-carrier protein] reductase